MDFSKWSLVETYTGRTGIQTYTFTSTKKHVLIGTSANWGSQTPVRLKITPSNCTTKYLLNNSAFGDATTNDGSIALTVVMVDNVKLNSKITIDPYWIYQVKIYEIDE